MVIDFSNINTVWVSIVVETLARLGLTTAVISPGSRSTPLTIAFARHSSIDTIPVLDERSAAFFALGIAKRTGKPSVLVCTSGTAGANYFPAVIEARESRVPLLVFTADRPPELRHCHSGQTIDQLNLFGNYPNWHTDIGIPDSSLTQLRYLRQTCVHAWRRSLQPVPGVVHLNFPFRDPLYPLATTDTQSLKSAITKDFFSHLKSWKPCSKTVSLSEIPWQYWRTCQRGLIVAGPAEPINSDAYCRVVAQVSYVLGWPVLAEGLSPLRNHAHLNQNLVAHYDFLLRQPAITQTLTPDIVLQLGPLPTSKELRAWLTQLEPQTWQLDSGDRNFDPLHSRTLPLDCSVDALAAAITQVPDSAPNTGSSNYLKEWLALDQQMGAAIDEEMAGIDRLCDSKVAWMLPHVLPEGTPVAIANSTPVRDVEWFWRLNERRIRPCFNRGANGIDGTLSTALGLVHGGDQAGVLLTGDLALLHDSNGGLIRRQVRGHLTIVLINNDGGGIFNLLPISEYEPPFEDLFATPQSISLEQWCRTYGITYHLVEDWKDFEEHLRGLPTRNVRLLEVKTDRYQEAKWRKRVFETLGETLVD